MQCTTQGHPRSKTSYGLPDDRSAVCKKRYYGRGVHFWCEFFHSCEKTCSPVSVIVRRCRTGPVYLSSRLQTYTHGWPDGTCPSVFSSGAFHRALWLMSDLVGQVSPLDVTPMKLQEFRSLTTTVPEKNASAKRGVRTRAARGLQV